MSNRKHPYTTAELASFFTGAENEDQRLDTLADHIAIGGTIKASFLLKHTECESAQDCFDFVHKAELRVEQRRRFYDAKSRT